MAVETDLLSNHNDSTKCQSSSPATSAVNDDQVDLAFDDDSGSIDSTSPIFIAGHVDFAMESITAVDNAEADDDDVIDVPDFETTTAPVDGDHYEATATAPPIAESTTAVKKMPKRRKTFGSSQKRGGNRKLGDGGEGIAYMPPVAPTRFAVALQPDTHGTSITPSNQMKYIPKKTLFRQLQQMEVNILILVHPQLVAQFVKLTASPFYPTDSMPTCTGTGCTTFR